MPTVAESLVKTLVEAGVKRIYGIVGDSLNGITDAIRREKTIQWIQEPRGANIWRKTRLRSRSS